MNSRVRDPAQCPHKHTKAVGRTDDGPDDRCLKLCCFSCRCLAPHTLSFPDRHVRRTSSCVSRTAVPSMWRTPRCRNRTRNELDPHADSIAPTGLTFFGPLSHNAESHSEPCTDRHFFHKVVRNLKVCTAIRTIGTCLETSGSVSNPNAHRLRLTSARRSSQSGT